MEARDLDEVREIDLPEEPRGVTPAEFVARVFDLRPGRALQINRGPHFVRLCRRIARENGWELRFTWRDGVVTGAYGKQQWRLSDAGRRNIRRGVRLRWQRYREEKAKGAAAK